MQGKKSSSMPKTSTSCVTSIHSILGAFLILWKLSPQWSNVLSWLYVKSLETWVFGIHLQYSYSLIQYSKIHGLNITTISRSLTAQVFLFWFCAFKAILSVLISSNVYIFIHIGQFYTRIVSKIYRFIVYLWFIIEPEILWSFCSCTFWFQMAYSAHISI